MKNKSTVYIVQAALIAALYATLTILQNVLLPGTASAAVQFRVSEILTILALYTPAAIPGLTIGCVVANISSVVSGLGAYDMIFGSFASLLAALTMYALRKLKLAVEYDGKKKFDMAIPALLMPAVMNGLIVGFEIDFFFVNNLSFNFIDFLVQGGLVALGEVGVLIVLGLPLTKLIEARGWDKVLAAAGIESAKDSKKTT